MSDEKEGHYSFEVAKPLAVDKVVVVVMGGKGTFRMLHLCMRYMEIVSYQLSKILQFDK